MTRCCIPVLLRQGHTLPLDFWHRPNPTRWGLRDTAHRLPYKRFHRLLWQPCQKIKGEERRQNLTLLRQTRGVKYRANTPEVLTSERVFTGLGLVLQAGGWKRCFICGGLRRGEEVLATARLFNEGVMPGKKKCSVLLFFFPFALL